MAVHKRRKILNDLKTSLLTLGYAGARNTRYRPNLVAYPYITYWVESENTQTLTVHPQPRPQDRKFTVSVRSWRAGTPDTEKPETDMDADAVAIEAVMTKPTNADDIELLATDFDTEEDDPQIHHVTLTFLVSYNSTEFSATV
jgi:hypothetical protein